MRRLSVKWLGALAIAIFLALVGGVLGVNSLLSAIDNGKLKRAFADVRNIATALHNYRADHGGYPIDWSGEKLSESLKPDYLRVIPPHRMSYYSDGTNYTLIIWPSLSDDGAGAIPEDAVGPIEVRNGRIVAWPDFASEEWVEALQEGLRALHDPKRAT